MELLNEGKTPDEIRAAAVEQNIFGAAREDRAKRMDGFYDEKGYSIFIQSSDNLLSCHPHKLMV